MLRVFIIRLPSFILPKITLVWHGRSPMPFLRQFVRLNFIKRYYQQQWINRRKYCNKVYSGFIIYLSNMSSIWLCEPHKIASRAACGPRVGKPWPRPIDLFSDTHIEYPTMFWNLADIIQCKVKKNLRFFLFLFFFFAKLVRRRTR